MAGQVSNEKRRIRNLHERECPVSPSPTPAPESPTDHDAASPKPAEVTKPRSRLSRAVRRAVFGFAVLHVAAVVAVWLLLRLAGDRWWFATLLLYGPRWIYALPLAVLVPAALLWRRAALWPLALAGLIVAGPIMGLCIPWRKLISAPPAADRPRLRVLSFNVRRFAPSPEAYQDLLLRLKPDVIAIQEHAGWTRTKAKWKLPDTWNVHQAGELMVASRYPILRVEVSRCDLGSGPPVINGIYCVLDTPQGEVGFCCLHLDTPRRGLSLVLNRGDPDLSMVQPAEQRIEGRRQESADVARWLRSFPQPKIIAGDFNMTTDSTIYREAWSGYRNAFDTAGFGYGHTKITVIRRRSYGLRIDHILADEHWQPVDCWVGPDIGSDHLPLIADLVRARR